MCIRIGIEWRCKHKWRGWYSCPGRSGEEGSCPNTARNKNNGVLLSPVFEQITRARKEGYFLKVCWCCSPQCCNAEFAEKEQHCLTAVARYETLYGTGRQESAQDPARKKLLDHKGHKKSIYNESIKTHYNYCIPHFIRGLGRLKSMRSGTYNFDRDDMVPIPNMQILQGNIFKAGGAFDIRSIQYEHAIRAGGGQPITREAVDQYLAIREYILANPQSATKLWAPQATWATLPGPRIVQNFQPAGNTNRFASPEPPNSRPGSRASQRPSASQKSARTASADSNQSSGSSELQRHPRPPFRTMDIEALERALTAPLEPIRQQEEALTPSHALDESAGALSAEDINNLLRDLETLDPSVNEGLEALSGLSGQPRLQAYLYLRLERNSRQRWAQLDCILTRVRHEHEQGQLPGVNYTRLFEALKIAVRQFIEASDSFTRWLGDQGSDLFLLVTRLETHTGSPSPHASQQSSQAPQERSNRARSLASSDEDAPYELE